MNYAILGQVIQRDKYLNCESFDQIEWETLEVVHLYEFIEVDREHFESNH